MGGYAKIVEERVGRFPYFEMIMISELFQELEGQVTAASLAKNLARLCRGGTLRRLARGVYYRPKPSEFGLMLICDEDIAHHFIKDNRGLFIGYRLYNRRYITTQVATHLDVLSTALKEKHRCFENVHVWRIDVELDAGTAAALETLEILQNFTRIQDYDAGALISYMREFCRGYSQESMDRALSTGRYRKSAIAFLAMFLERFEVPNNLEERYLSPRARYRFPSMEELDEQARYYSMDAWYL